MPSIGRVSFSGLFRDSWPIWLMVALLGIGLGGFLVSALHH